MWHILALHKRRRFPDRGCLPSSPSKEIGVEIGPPLPVMTASDEEKIKREAIQTGCIAYLRKPFAAELLVDIVKKALADSPTREAPRHEG
jgi:CheY-like chemotaxis protein